MRKRILSTFLLWTIVLVCIGFFKATGGIWLLTLIAVLTLREFYTLVRRLGLEPFDRVGMLFGARHPRARLLRTVRCRPDRTAGRRP